MSSNNSNNAEENNATSTSTPNVSLDVVLIKSQILSGELKISSKRGRSKVWETFGNLENVSGEELKEVVVCRTCLNVYKYNGKSTSNLVRHKCYVSSKLENQNNSKVEVDSATKKKGSMIFTEWAVENCRPFKLVEDTGFKKVAEFLISVGATFGPSVDVKSLLPHSTTISRNVKRIYNIYFEKVKTEICSIKEIGFGLTSDLWTDNYIRRTYIAVTVHYIKDGNIVSRLLGMKSMNGEKCTRNYFFLPLFYYKTVFLLLCKGYSFQKLHVGIIRQFYSLT